MVEEEEEEAKEDEDERTALTADDRGVAEEDDEAKELTLSRKMTETTKVEPAEEEAKDQDEVEEEDKPEDEEEDATADRSRRKDPIKDWWKWELKLRLCLILEKGLWWLSWLLLLLNGCLCQTLKLRLSRWRWLWLLLLLRFDLCDFMFRLSLLRWTESDCKIELIENV